MTIWLQRNYFERLPIKFKTTFDHKCPFYDAELLFLKKKKRNFEQLYRKTRSVDLKVDLDFKTKNYFDEFLEKRALFINNVLYGKPTRQNYAL